MTATTTRDGWLEDRQFGIVLDAGSSGTRIQVYSWKSPEAQQKERLANHQSIRVLPRIETGVQDGSEWQLKAEPGISSFGSHPHHLGQYLKRLLDHALKLIPPAQIPTTPFYLLATAGMRLLPQSQQDDILQEVCRYIKGNYRFRIHHCHQHVQIISGEEEGTFGWLAVNYLMDGFDPPHHASSASASKQPSSTFGFLDMGGASTQIAFEPNPLAQIEHADNLTKLTLRLLDGTDISHSVFVTTWLGYGTNKARERYAQQLVQQHSSDHQTSARIQQQSQSAIIPDPCLPTSLVLPSPSPNYHFNGTGDFKQCIQNVSPLLNKNAPCLDEPCLFDGKHVPPIDFSVNRFIGISEYWYSTQDLWSMGGIYDFVEFEKKAISYCQLNWGEIIENHKSGTTWPSNVEISRLETQCFKAAWIINILHEGIGIPRIIDKGGRGDRKDYNQQGVQKAAQKGLLNSPSPAGFQSLNEVGNITVSWTLGKMVLELSQQLSSSRHPSSEEHSFGRPQHEKDMKEPLSHARSWVNPMVFIVVILGALLCWFLYSYSRTLCQFQKERRLGGQGYVLASMEEGDGGRRESHHSRGQNTARFFRKPSLSSSRGLSPYADGAGLIQQTVSRAMRAWTHSPFSTSSHPNAASRAGRGSPNFAKLQAAGTSEDDGRHEPPVSITTSLSAPVGGAGFQASVSARTSLEDGLFMSVPISRVGSSTGRLFDDRPSTLPPHSSPHLDSPGQTDLLFPTPDRPKYRFSHSKSFQSLSSPQHHHHLDELDYQPSAIHDRAHSSSPSHHHSFHPHFQHQHHQQQQQNILNSHSCSNLTDFNLHSQ